jgi:hypothetical protein
MDETDYTLEITRYFIDQDGSIKITHVKVLDKKGKYIKFAKLSQVIKYLPTLGAKWKSIEP